MSTMAIGALMAGLGGASGLLGNIMGGAAANRGRRQARDDLRQQWAQSMRTAGYPIFGAGMPSYLNMARRWQADPNDPNKPLMDENGQPVPFTDADREAQGRQFMDATLNDPNSLIGRFGALAPWLQQQQQGLAGGIENQRGRFMGAIGDAQNQLGDVYNQQLRQTVGAFKPQAQNLMGMAQRNEQRANAFGAGGEDLIRQDFSRLGNAAQSQIGAAYKGGLGGLGAQKYLDASSRLGSAQANALQQQRNAAYGAQTGARQQTMGLGSNLLGLESGMRSQLAGQYGSGMGALGQLGAQGAERFGQASINQQQGALNQQLSAKQLPLQMLMQQLTGGLFNPWSAGSQLPPPPSISPFGVGLQTAGNSLSGLGGNMMSFGMMQKLLGKAA